MPSTSNTKKVRIKRKKKRIWPMIVIGIGIAICSGLLIQNILTPTKPSVEEAKQYLTAQSAKDAAQISQIIQESKVEKLLKKVKDNTVSPFALMKNSVLFGDSRALGFETYNYLSAAQTWCTVGSKITDIPYDLSQITQMKPDVLYFSYGVNDLISGVGGSISGYVEECEKVIQRVAEASPSSKVAINSILPVQESAQRGEMTNSNIKEANSLLKKMCEKNKWIYIDNSSLELDSYYGTDGIHMKSDFYPLWGMNMVQKVLGKETKNSSSSTETKDQAEQENKEKQESKEGQEKKEEIKENNT